MSDWWVQQPGKRPEGPITTSALTHALAGGRLPAGTLVCSVMPGSPWTTPQSIPQLAGAFAYGRPQATPLAYAAPPADPEGGYQGGYVQVKQKAEPSTMRSEWTRPASRTGRASLALVITAFLCFAELALFGIGFVFMSRIDPLLSAKGLTLLAILFVFPFVATCYYGWVSWGLARYSARAYPRAQRGHVMFAIVATLGGVFALIWIDVVIGVLVLSPLVLYALCWWTTRRAKSELREE